MSEVPTLADILQLYYMARDKPFDGTDIGPNDVGALVAGLALEDVVALHRRQ